MPKVRLISENASVTCGGVTLTPDSPVAEAEKDIALLLFDSGKVEILCNDNEEPPFTDDEVLDVPGGAQDEEPVNTDTIEAELSACSKVADYEAMAKKYNIDLSGCTNKQQRIDAIKAAFEL